MLRPQVQLHLDQIRQSFIWLTLDRSDGRSLALCCVCVFVCGGVGWGWGEEVEGRRTLDLFTRVLKGTHTRSTVPPPLAKDSAPKLASHWGASEKEIMLYKPWHLVYTRAWITPWSSDSSADSPSVATYSTQIKSTRSLNKVKAHSLIISLLNNRNI